MKQITDYPNYFVTEDGKVWANGKRKKFLRPKLDKGYYRVSLRNKYQIKMFAVHRLVAISYIPNNLQKPQVNHIDGNKLNNNLSNLEWCTRSENHLHGYRIGILKISEKCRQSVREKMSKLVLNTETGIYYNSAKEASDSCNIKYYTLLPKLNGWKRVNNTPFIYV